MKKFNESSEYYVVKGWFEANNGLNNGTFYGAVATPDNLLQPKRVVLYGEEAKKASCIAAQQPAKVYPDEIFESYDPADIADFAGTPDHGLNPRDEAESQDMLLDSSDWAPEVKDWAAKRNCEVWFNGRQLFVDVPRGAADPEAYLEELRAIVPGVDIDWGYNTSPMGKGYHLVTEMVSTGAIAERPNALQSPTNTSYLGMSDRGGHGRVNNLRRGGKKDDKKKVQVGNNIKGSKRRLKGFGSKHELPTVSQSGGKRGGNQ